LAKEYHSRPSAIVGIEDDWAAYQFDMACLQFARHVDKELDKKRSISAILSETSPQTRYADIRQLGPIRTMKIPDSGVW
jgi:hypothetical protein